MTPITNKATLSGTGYLFPFFSGADFSSEFIVCDKEQEPLSFVQSFEAHDANLCAYK